MMAHPTKVESYLKRHRIGPFFENMMGKLMKEMPADPLDYLASLIQEQKQKQKPNSVEFSDGKSASKSLWSSDTKEYEKPWRAHSRKTKPSSPDERKDWDKTVKLTSKSFDEITLSKHVSKSPKALTFQRGSNGVSTADAGDDFSMTEEELLSAEIPVAKTVSRASAQPSPPVVKRHSKQKGPKADSSRHNQELKVFLQEKRAEKERDSGIGSGYVSSDGEENVGPAELTEDAEDLADEGVKVTSDNRKQVKKVTNRRAAPAEPLIHMSVCSNCAKVVLDSRRESDSDSSTSTALTRESRGQGQSSVRSDQWATHRTDSRAKLVQNPAMGHPESKSRGFTQQTTHLPTTDRTSKQTTHMPTTDRASKQTTHLPTTDRTGFSSYYSDDDDEFESVSQISGNLPRVPMWSMSDEEDLAPVKGASMLTSPRVGTKKTSSQRKTVTLKEDMLKGLPQSTNTISDFIGSNTWSGEKVPTEKSLGVSRRSYESKPSKARNSRGSGNLTTSTTAGWKFNPPSDDDDSTLLYK